MSTAYHRVQLTKSLQSIPLSSSSSLLMPYAIDANITTIGPYFGVPYFVESLIRNFNRVKTNPCWMLLFFY
ncbi:hypothetical protein BLOT_012848 [Blomia tropicalis]|nr:hypothetical protein BLOT_012848 [Blomia tropicalis]